MSDVLAITIPIFLLIGAGYLAFRYRVMQPEQARALGAFVLNFALPALIIRALSGRRPAEIANFRYLLAYAVASLAVFALVFCVSRYGRRRPLTQSAIQAMGSSVSNSGFLGYPTASLVVGQVAGVALSLNMVVENVLMIPLALALAEAGRGTGATLRDTVRSTAARLAVNPLVIAIVIGTISASPTKASASAECVRR